MNNCNCEKNSRKYLPRKLKQSHRNEGLKSHRADPQQNQDPKPDRAPCLLCASKLSFRNLLLRSSQNFEVQTVSTEVIQEGRCSSLSTLPKRLPHPHPGFLLLTVAGSGTWPVPHSHNTNRGTLSCLIQLNSSFIETGSL